MMPLCLKYVDISLLLKTCQTDKDNFLSFLLFEKVVQMHKPEHFALNGEYESAFRNGYSAEATFLM